MKRQLVLLLAFVALLVAVTPVDAGEPSLDEMLAQIRDGGYVVLAEQAGKTHRIANAAELKALFQDPDPITFFLLDPDSGKKHKVGQAPGGDDKSESWGAKIWRFYCCFAGEQCCNK